MPDPVFSGLRRSSDQYETFSGDGILAVPIVSGSRRRSDQHGASSVAGILADPGFAGLRGRRALRAARRVQVSEKSCRCTDSLDVSSLVTQTFTHLVFPSHPLLILHMFTVCLVSCLHLVHVVVVHLFVSLEHCAGFVRRVHVNLWSVLVTVRRNTVTKLLEQQRC